MLKAALYTLGCKLNQFETNFMIRHFEEMGYEIVRFPEFADVYLINTCAVTLKSETHSRHAVRKAARKNTNAMIIVTGCAAQVNPESFSAIPGVDLVLGNREKRNLPYYIKRLSEGYSNKIEVSEYTSGDSLPINHMVIDRFSDYTRAFIKVQEGCDAGCTYCIVPKARGPARSVSMEEIVRQADILWSTGYREIVLTGIHLGQYGKDFAPKSSLGELLDLLLKNIGKNRLRLSSIEPNEIDDKIQNHISLSQGLCPHFHIPLQSGSESILNMMGRRYTTGFYREVVHNIVANRPDASIGADIMVGFPGESEDDFKMTYNFLESLPLAYLHVFSFSPRPGTAAANMSNQVNGKVKRNRSLILRRLGQKKNMLFRSKFLNKELVALILNQDGTYPDCKIALTGNYIPIYIRGARKDVNRMALVKIEKTMKDRTWGRITQILD